MTLKNKIGDVLTCTGKKIKTSVKRNFPFATLNFVFIFVFMQVFQLVFGAENSIVAVILTILMGIYAGRDVSSTPLKQFVIHTFVLASLSTAACYSVALGPWIAIPINLVTSFCVLYAYTYDYSNHLYFPYILSYLFLVYISPVAPERLSFRLLSVVAGTFIMLIYALILRPRNIVKPAKNAMMRLLNIAVGSTRIIADKGVAVDMSEEARNIGYELTRNIDLRIKDARIISDASFSMLNVGRGTENLITLLSEIYWTEPTYAGLWPVVIDALTNCKTFAAHKTQSLPEIDAGPFGIDERTRYLYNSLSYVRVNLLKAHGDDGLRHDGMKVSVKLKLKSFLSFSPMKLTYAVRVSLLLTAFMIPVQYLALPHGKWLMFTLASVSLPYADDVRAKGQKRLLATIIGGTISTICFSLIPDTLIRTIIMMLSGYLSFYFAGYTGNYACATIGAFGGAVATGITGWTNVSVIFAKRLGYIAAGIIIAYIVNLVFFPYRRKKASENLFKNYEKSVSLLCKLDASVIPDKQTYYDIVIKNNLLEAKLLSNSTSAHKRDEVTVMIADCRRHIQKAHHRAFYKDTA